MVEKLYSIIKVGSLAYFPLHEHTNSQLAISALYPSRVWPKFAFEFLFLSNGEMGNQAHFASENFEGMITHHLSVLYCCYSHFNYLLGSNSVITTLNLFIFLMEKV